MREVARASQIYFNPVQFFFFLYITFLILILLSLIALNPILQLFLSVHAYTKFLLMTIKIFTCPYGIWSLLLLSFACFAIVLFALCLMNKICQLLCFALLCVYSSCCCCFFFVSSSSVIFCYFFFVLCFAAVDTYKSHLGSLEVCTTRRTSSLCRATAWLPVGRPAWVFFQVSAALQFSKTFAYSSGARKLWITLQVFECAKGV